MPPPDLMTVNLPAPSARTEESTPVPEPLLAPPNWMACAPGVRLEIVPEPLVKAVTKIGIGIAPA